jgi:hypothetical protein
MWSPKPDVVKYTALLRAAYPRIHASDPAATVITGGTSPAYDAPDGSQVLPLTWLRGIYTNGGGGSFDAVGHHPSTFPNPANTPGSWNAFTQSNALHALMAAHGDGAKHIWATEIAFPTGTNKRAVDETTQGLRLAQAIQLWQALPYAGAAFIYETRDAGTNRSDIYENLGILHADGSPKADYRSLVRLFGGVGL